MKNFSSITEKLDITTKKYVDDGLASKANLAGNNTFTGGQRITGADGGYSINASGYVRGSWLQSSVIQNKGSNTGKVCVFDDAGWVYYRTPAEILSEAGGAKSSDIPDISGKANLEGGNQFTGEQVITRNDAGVLLNVTNAIGDSFFQIDQNASNSDGCIYIGMDTAQTPISFDGDFGLEGQALLSRGSEYTPMWGDITKHGYTQLTNERLSTIKEAGWYSAVANNTCADKPSAMGTDAFILIVEKEAANNIKQTCYKVVNAYDILASVYIRYISSTGGVSGWYPMTLVHSQSQTFSGRKTFSDGINLTGSLQINGSSGASGQVLTSNGDGVPVWKDMGGSADIMPTIRLVSIADTAGTCICSAANPLRFSFVVEKGTLLPTDEVQLCSRQLFTYKKGHMLYPGGTIVHGRTYKLRSFLSRGISTITQINGYYVFEINNYPELREFVRSNMGAGEHSTLIKYLRISRNPGSNVGNRLFSNVIPIYVAPSAPNSTTQTVKIRIR